MSATLGGLLKDYRLQKNLSQLEIAFAMGWKEPSRLSRIEQGKIGNPPGNYTLIFNSHRFTQIISPILIHTNIIVKYLITLLEVFLCSISLIDSTAVLS